MYLKIKLFYALTIFFSILDNLFCMNHLHPTLIYCVIFELYSSNVTLLNILNISLCTKDGPNKIKMYM